MEQVISGFQELLGVEALDVVRTHLQVAQGGEEAPGQVTYSQTQDGDA